MERNTPTFRGCSEDQDRTRLAPPDCPRAPSGTWVVRGVAPGHSLRRRGRPRRIPGTSAAPGRAASLLRTRPSRLCLRRRTGDDGSQSPSCRGGIGCIRAGEWCGHHDPPLVHREPSRTRSSHRPGLLVLGWPGDDQVATWSRSTRGDAQGTHLDGNRRAVRARGQRAIASRGGGRCFGCLLQRLECLAGGSEEHR